MRTFCLLGLLCLVAGSASAQALEIGVGAARVQVRDDWEAWDHGPKTGTADLHVGFYPSRRFSIEAFIGYGRSTWTENLGRPLVWSASTYTCGIAVRQRVGPDAFSRVFGFVTFGVLGWHERTRVEPAGIFSTSRSRRTIAPTLPTAGLGVEGAVTRHLSLRGEAQVVGGPFPPFVVGARVVTYLVVR